MKLKKLIGILFLAVLIGACSAKQAPKEMTNDMIVDSSKGESVAPTENTKPSFDSTGRNQNTNATKIIHTIGLDLESKEYATTLSEIEALTRSLNGYVQSSTIPRNRGDEKYQGLIAYYVLMIPTENIDKFILSAGEVSNIVNESRNALNITEAYSDTESRIKNLKTKEARLLDLLKQSGTLADLLQIETELSNTRYEIEQLETALQGYDNRIAYTQFNVNVREVYTYSPAKRDGVWERISDEFTNNWQNFVWSVENMFIFLISTLPFMLIQLLILAVPLLIIFFLYRRWSGNHYPHFGKRNQQTTHANLTSQGKDNQDQNNIAE